MTNLYNTISKLKFYLRIILYASFNYPSSCSFDFLRLNIENTLRNKNDIIDVSDGFAVGIKFARRISEFVDISVSNNSIVSSMKRS